MNTSKILLARKRLLSTKKTKLIIIWLFLIPSLGACGMSVGESCAGSVSFCDAHNRKLEIIRGSSEQPRWAK